jgi:predicted DNA-binding transcriptional regulator AlpA
MRKGKRGGTTPPGQFPEPQKAVPLPAPVEVTGPIRILTKEDVCRLINNISGTTLWNYIRDEGFPPARVFGPDRGRRSIIGWIDTEVYTWIANRPQRLPKGSKTLLLGNGNHTEDHKPEGE